MKLTIVMHKRLWRVSIAEATMTRTHSAKPNVQIKIATKVALWSVFTARQSCVKVMLSVVSVNLSISHREGSHVTTTNDAIGQSPVT